MRFPVLFLLVALTVFAFAPRAVAGETVDDLLKAARTSFNQGQTEEALKLAAKAIDLDPKSPRPYLFRGALHEALGQHAAAIADFDKTIALDPKSADAYNRRGSEQFKLGKVAASIADFDKFIELRPDEKAGHWKRGISYYYAGRFDDGRQQFEGYEKVDTNDVENAVWHFLCNARVAGIDKARTAILKIGNDRRVPMMQVYSLYSGKSKPADVLTAVQGGQPGVAELNGRLFYAHLYLGLYYEAAGDKKRALEHMSNAVEHKIGHYMWDVANVHRALLKKETER